MAKVKNDRKAKLQAAAARGGGRSARSAGRAAKAAPKAAARGAKPAAKGGGARGAGRSGGAAKRSGGAAAGGKRTAAAKVSHVAPGYHAVTPTLCVEDCAKALDFYKEAFGAVETSRFPSPDGAKIMHAEIKIDGSPIMLNDPMMGMKGASAAAPSPAGVWLYVSDCDALFDKATKAGATVTMPLADQFWGDRCGGILDPFGVRWGIATHQKDMTRDEMRAAGEEFMKKMAAGGGGPEGASGSGGTSEAPAA